VVRRFGAAVYAGRTRPQWPANEGPINPASDFKQAVRGSGRGARGDQCVLKPLRKIAAPPAAFKASMLRSPATMTGQSESTACCIR
jgi:hypothetical protein